jgi:hypothetical protein
VPLHMELSAEVMPGINQTCSKIQDKTSGSGTEGPAEGAGTRRNGLTTKHSEV